MTMAYTPDDYQLDALQTESQPSSLVHNRDQVDALESLFEAAERFGAAADKLKKHLFYGREVNLYELIEVDLERVAPETSVALASVNSDLRKIRLVHAFLGLFSELEEIAGPLRRHIFEGEELDVTNLMEEGGDKLWYLAAFFDACGFKMSEAMHRNISKLAKRYPEKKFSSVRALVRDTEAERAELEGASVAPPG